jgi:DNA-binding response OmpR family regulator
MSKISKISPRNIPLVLIADDDMSIRSLLTLALQEEGYEVEEASDGEECLAKYLRLQPDLLLLDAVMPGMDGFTCCERLRALPRGQEVPIIAITFLDDRESIDRAFQAGATDYITKPIHWSVLRQRVRYLLLSSQISQPIETTKTQLLEGQSWEDFLRIAIRQLYKGDRPWEMLPNLLKSIQEFFQVERALLYQVENQHLVEAVALGYPSLRTLPLLDLGLQKEYGNKYQQGEIAAIKNLRNLALEPNILEQFAQLQTLSISFGWLFEDSSSDYLSRGLYYLFSYSFNFADFNHCAHLTPS